MGLTGVREDGAPPCTPADNAHPNATRVLLTLLCHKGAWLGYIHLSTSLTSLFLPFLGSCLPVSQPSACSGAQSYSSLGAGLLLSFAELHEVPICSFLQPSEVPLRAPQPSAVSVTHPGFYHLWDFLRRLFHHLGH